MFGLNTKTDFPTSAKEDWITLVEKGLRGADLDSLNRKTEDEISRGPLMRAADMPTTLGLLGRTDLPLLEGRSWHIAAPVRDPDPRHANTQLLEDLKGGASAVRFEEGVVLDSRSNLKRLLEGVYTDLVPIQFSHDVLTDETFDQLQSLDNLKTAILWAGLDPIENTDLIANALETAPKNWRLMGLTPAKTHEAGGTDVQELSALAASLAEAMRTYGAANVCAQLVIELAADRDMHLTIAKFRAARRIVRRIAEAFSADGARIPICAVTSLRMMQTEDAWTNLLRVMSAGTGAVIGGADVVTTRPFTDGLGQATPFAHRIARNMQLMMMEESHLGHVYDAAHGSYWHEDMTDQLAQKAWQTFQKIEAAGGWSNYKNSGQLQAELESSRAARERQNDPILGVTLHPAQNVKAPEVRS
jgi:methylmalonyl-CoA mutase